MSDFIIITGKAARVNAGISVIDAAKELGVSRTTLTNYESGRSSPPWEIVERMSELYNYPKSGFSFARQSPKSASKKGR